MTSPIEASEGDVLAEYEKMVAELLKENTILKVALRQTQGHLAQANHQIAMLNGGTTNGEQESTDDRAG